MLVHVVEARHADRVIARDRVDFKVSRWLKADRAIVCDLKILELELLHVLGLYADGFVVRLQKYARTIWFVAR